ncbi:MAG: hypothetical protein K8S22_16255 [Betaproteobacteria bacterium]|nr:hypothetical protein [Betaproteobacteria bacterium]
MAAVGDLVGAGFVASLARPVGNVTGMSNIVRDLTGKQVQLPVEVSPPMRRVAIMRNPANPMMVLLLKEVDAAVRALGLQPQVVEVRTLADFEGAFESMRKKRAAGLCSSAIP